jgi:hypothetical protein
MNGRLWRQATCAIAIALLLGGCGSLVPSIPKSAAGAITEIPQINRRAGSWVLPEATNEDLLYVSEYSDVLIFTYPSGKPVGDLKGFFSAAGECVDSKGNVFITNDKPSGVYEYAHGGTKRIAYFRTTKTGARGCAISPTNGDLAICGFSSYVEIYKGAQGKPVAFRDKRMFYGGLDTYDDNGDLFFVGIKTGTGQRQQLSELRTGSSHFVNIDADAGIYVEGGFQWYGGFLTAVSDSHKVNIYQFQITGTKAHRIGVTPLGAPAYIVLQYFIDGKTVIIPNHQTSRSDVLYYKYPKGGSPTFTLPGNINPRGIVVSCVAQKKTVANKCQH